MTIGGVLAVVALVAALAAGWGATLLLASLVFPGRVRRASEAISAAPGACFGRGLGVLLVGALIALVLTNNPAGPVRLLGALAWGGLLLTAALGSAGIVRLMSERIGQVGSEMTPFAALTRGTALYVLAGLLPVLGWFVIAPLAAIVSLGGAAVALRRPRPVAVAPTPVTPELGAGANL